MDRWYRTLQYFVVSLLVISVPLLVWAITSGTTHDQNPFPSEPPNTPEQKDGSNQEKPNDPNKGNQNKSDNKGQKDSSHSGKNSNQIYWGVDSASPVDQPLNKCIEDHYGSPNFYGRYLATKENVSTGVTKQEIKNLHDKKAKVLLVYNHFTDATGKKKGINEAKQAIKYANALGVPKNIALFADIEPDYSVDHDFLKGWIETINKSKYTPGFYGTLDDKSSLKEAFNQLSNNQKDNVILWSSTPVKGTTSKDHAPDFKPDQPNKSHVEVWQYGQEADQCNMDTDLITSKGFNLAW